MLKCMIANGFLSREMAVKVVAMEPYEYLQTAELNQRPVGFIPAGTRVRLTMLPRHFHCHVCSHSTEIH